jgi:cobalamin biosynthesis protein CobT
MTKYIPETAALDDVVMTGSELMESTSLVVKAMSTDFGTRVTFAGDGAFTDGDDVNLPSLPMDAKVTKRTALVLAGYGSHEGLHKVLTGFDRLRPLMQRAHADGKWLTKSMANGLEDVRIEHGGTHLYGGIAQAIDKTAREVNRKFLDEVYPEMPDVVDDFGRIGPVAVTWEGRRRLGYPDPSNEECLDLLPKKIRSKVDKIVDQVMKIPHGVTDVGKVDTHVAHQGSVDVWKLATKIANGHMKEVIKIEKEKWEIENPPPPPPTEDEQPDGPIEIEIEVESEDESEDEGEGKGKGKPKEKEDTDEDKPDDGDGEGNDEGADNEGDADDDPDGEDGAGDSDSDTDGEGDEGGDEGEEGSPDDGDGDPVEPGNDAGDGEDETNQGDREDDGEEGDSDNPGETNDDEGSDEDGDEDDDGEGESGSDDDAGELGEQEDGDEDGDEGVSDGVEQDAEEDADGAEDAEDGDGEDGDTGTEGDDSDGDEEQDDYRPVGEPDCTTDEDQDEESLDEGEQEAADDGDEADEGESGEDGEADELGEEAGEDGRTGEDVGGDDEGSSESNEDTEGDVDDGDDDGVDEGIDDEGETDGDKGEGEDGDNEPRREDGQGDEPDERDEDDGDKASGDVGPTPEPFDPSRIHQPLPIEPGLHEAMQREVDSLKQQNGGNGYIVANPSGDQFIPRRKLSDDPDVKREGGQRYTESKNRVSAAVGTVRRKLERVVTAMHRSYYENGKRNGKLDVRRNVSKIVNLKSNVFRNKVDEVNINTAMSLLLDLSGSMSICGKDAMAQQITIAVAEALAPVGVPLEVLGHQTCMMEMAHNKVVFDEEIYGRWDNIRLTQFKDFEDSIAACRSTMGSIEMHTGYCNADGDAIIMAAKRLYERPEEKKVLFVLSDGQPAYHSQTRCVHQYTRDAVEWCLFRGIDVMGLGMLDDSVKQYYPKYVTVHDLDEFGRVYIDQIVKLMLDRALPDQSLLIDTTAKRFKNI